VYIEHFQTQFSILSTLLRQSSAINEAQFSKEPKKSSHISSLSSISLFMLFSDIILFSSIKSSNSCKYDDLFKIKVYKYLLLLAQGVSFL
jgi:hypothetical protein